MSNILAFRKPNIDKNYDIKLLEKQLVVALEILINEKLMIFEIEKYEESRYNYLEGKAKYIINYTSGVDMALSIIDKAKEILDGKESNPHIELLKVIFSDNKDTLFKYSSIIKEMENKGIISIKVTNSSIISYDAIVEELICAGYSINLESLYLVPKGTVLLESPNYVIYKSIIPKKKPSDYIYNTSLNTLTNIWAIVDSYKNSEVTMKIRIPDEAFNISITKIEALCKLVWLHYNSSKENNISSIFSSVVNDYFNKFYKISEQQRLKLNNVESELFIKEYFKIIESGFNSSNIYRCKNIASEFFELNIEF